MMLHLLLVAALAPIGAAYGSNNAFWALPQAVAKMTSTTHVTPKVCDINGVCTTNSMLWSDAWNQGLTAGRDSLSFGGWSAAINNAAFPDDPFVRCMTSYVCQISQTTGQPGYTSLTLGFPVWDKCTGPESRFGWCQTVQPSNGGTPPGNLLYEYADDPALTYQCWHGLTAGQVAALHWSCLLSCLGLCSGCPDLCNPPAPIYENLIPIASGMGALLSTCTRDADCIDNNYPYCRTNLDTANAINFYWWNPYFQAIVDAGGGSQWTPYVKTCSANPIQCSADSDCPFQHKCITWGSYAINGKIYVSADCQLAGNLPAQPDECVDDFQCVDKPGTICVTNPNIDCSYTSSVTTTMNGTRLPAGSCKYSMSDAFTYDSVTLSGGACSLHDISTGACTDTGAYWDNGAVMSHNVAPNNLTWRATCQCAVGSVSSVAANEDAVINLLYSIDKGYKTISNSVLMPSGIVSRVDQTLIRNAIELRRSAQSAYGTPKHTISDTCGAGYACESVGPSKWTSNQCIGWSSKAFNLHEPACQYMGYPTELLGDHTWSCQCDAGAIGDAPQYIYSTEVSIANSYSVTQGCRDNCQLDVCNSNGLCTYGVPVYPGFSSDLTQIGSSYRTQPCDCNEGWTSYFCQTPDYNAGCCSGNGLYGYYPAGCMQSPFNNCPNFQIIGPSCSDGSVANATHPAYCHDGSRSYSNVTCYGINDAASVSGQPSRSCTCFPNYYGADCSMNQTQCDATVCMGNGQCIRDTQANDIECICDAGWATYPPYQAGKPYTWRSKVNNNLGDNYQCQYPIPVSYVSPVTGLTYNDYATLSQMPCGPYGTPHFQNDGTPIYWVNGQQYTNQLNQGRNYKKYITTGGGFSGTCSCHMDAYGVQNAATSYCVKQASVWMTIASNDTSDNLAGFQQPCGAPYRGQVIQSTDQFGSTDCFCYNGYGGLDCSIVQCPTNPTTGDPCSGPGSLDTSTGVPVITGRGYCDVASGHCLCNVDVVGDACEIDWKQCGNPNGYSGQVIQ